MTISYNNEIIWIIGASSGIGQALAYELAAAGATLALSARRAGPLEALKAETGEQHSIHPLDVAEEGAIARAISAIQATHGRIDRVVFLPAAYKPMRCDALDLATTRQIIDVNLMSAFSLVQALLPVFKAQESGQLALCGSVAGYVGLPEGQPYSATKAGIINLAESLRAECPPEIDIKLISPGFVRTPMTDKNDFEMPMIITPQQAAKEIAKGLKSRAFEIHFPKRFTLLLKLLSLLPYALMLKVTRNIN